MPVRPIRVVLDASLRGGVDVEELSDVGDQLMSALIDVGAEDPFVSMDADGPSLLVEVVIRAESDTEALAHGARLIYEALGAAGVQNRAAMSAPSAHTEDLLPA